MTNTEQANPSFLNECPRSVARDNDRAVSMIPRISGDSTLILEGGLA